MEVITRFRLANVLYLRALYLLLVIFAGVQSGAAQPVKFKSPVMYPAGRPYVVSSGDFNGDGKVDLVAGDLTNSDLVILVGNGDGTLKAPITYHVNPAPSYLLVNDFNRDGKLDLIVSNSTPAQFSVLFGKGDGSFEAPVNYAVAGFRVLAADFNGDGKPDLVTRSTTTSLAVLLNNGDGSFQNSQVYPVPQPIVRVFTTGDFNGDGQVDLFAFGRDLMKDSPAFTSVLLGRGDGTFQPPINSNGTWAQGSHGK